jgi:hypothetical protein
MGEDFFGNPIEISHVIRSSAFPIRPLAEDFYISTGNLEESGAKFHVYYARSVKRSPASQRVKLKDARYIGELGRGKFFIDGDGRVFEIKSSFVRRAPLHRSRIRVDVSQVGAVSNDDCRS